MSKLEANSSKKNNSKEKPKKVTELFPEVGRKIKVYKNGDPYDAGINVVLNMRKIHDIGTFLDVINDKIYLTHGIKRLYTTTGQLVKKTSELQNEREYVASSGPFIPLNYGQKALQREHSMSVIRTNSSKISSTISRSISLNPRTKKKTTAVAEVKKEMNGHIPNGMARSKSFVQQKGAKIVKKVEVKPNANGGLPNAMPKRIPTGKKELAEKEAKKVKKEVDGVKKIKKKKVVKHKEEEHEEHHHEQNENHKNEHKSESEQEHENKRRESKISHQSASRTSSRKASPSEPEESEHSVHTPRKSSHHSRPGSTESKKSNDSRKSNHSKKSEAPHHQHSGHDSVSISSGINSQTESESDPAASRASTRNSRHSSKHSTK